MRDTTLYLLDGSLIRRTDLDKIDPKQVVSVQHLVGPAARERFGPAAREIIEITTWSLGDVSTRTNFLYFLDGTEIPPQLARVLDPKKIESIEVLKGPAARSYSTRALDGVVLVKIKEGVD